MIQRLIYFLSFIAVPAVLGIGSHAAWAGPNVWTSLGPDGGPIVSLAIDPQHPGTLYAGGWNSMILKSTDGGASWKIVYSELFGGTIQTIVIDPQNPNTVYAAGGRVFKSTDGGSNWTRLALPPLSVRTLAIDPKNSSVVYAGAFRGALKTTDAGVTWNAVNFTPTPEPDVSGLVIDPQNPETVYAATTAGLLKTTDGGGSWKRIDSRLTGNLPQALAIDPKNPDTLYVSEPVFTPGVPAKSTVFKSIDGGASWVIAGLPGGFCLHMAIDPQNPSTLYAVLVDGLVKSTDGAATWNAINSGLPAGFLRLAVDPQNAGTIYAANYRGAGVFKTTDGGTNWRAVNSGLRTTSIIGLAVDAKKSSTLFASSEIDLLKTTDAGTTWTSLNAGLPNARAVESLAVDPHDSNIVYAATWENVPQETTSNYPGLTFPPLPHTKLFRSTDGGANWNPVLDIGGTGTLILAFDPQNRDTVYAASPGTIYKSTDGGVNWVAMYSKQPSFFESLVIDPQNPSTLYVGGWGILLKSSDGGIDWEPADSGMTYIDASDNKTYHYDIQRLAIDPQAPGTLYATAYSTSDSGDAQIFKTTDGGASWNPLSSRPDCYFGDLAVSPRHPGTVYAGTSCGVFKSADGGMSWSPVNPGLSMLNVSSLVFDPQDAATLYAGTWGGGVFAMTFGPDLVVTDLKFDRTSVKAGASFSANISGPNLTAQSFFDVRLTGPGSNVSEDVLNWQRGATANHAVPAGTASGTWTINGVRAHEIEADHTGSFFPVSATITVAP